MKLETKPAPAEIYVFTVLGKLGNEGFANVGDADFGTASFEILRRLAGICSPSFEPLLDMPGAFGERVCSKLPDSPDPAGKVVMPGRGLRGRNLRFIDCPDTALRCSLDEEGVRRAADETAINASLAGGSPVIGDSLSKRLSTGTRGELPRVLDKLDLVGDTLCTFVPGISTICIVRLVSTCSAFVLTFSGESLRTEALREFGTLVSEIKLMRPFSLLVVVSCDGDSLTSLYCELELCIR